MTTGWIKLTGGQAADIAALSATNATENVVSPRAAADDSLWIAADALDEIAVLFAHYAPVLSGLTVTQSEPPTWGAP